MANTKNVALRLDPTLSKAGKEKAAEEGRPITSVIGQALAEYTGLLMAATRWPGPRPRSNEVTK